MKPVRLAIVGATGIVGLTTLDVLAEWGIPLADLKLYSSAESAGKKIDFCGSELEVRALTEIPNDLDVVILATSSTLSRELAPRFREAGVVVIDHSSCFRQEPGVPLVVPEINGHALKFHSGLIANPNCSASVMLLPLYALHKAAGLKQIIAATYQSVSGAGRAALDEMEAQFNGADNPPTVFPRQIAHNVIPEIGAFDANGTTGEEQKIGDEIRKILNLVDLPVLATSVRVPVHTGHSASLAIQLSRAATKSELETALAAQQGMIYEPADYRTPLEIAGRQEVFVSRLRIDPNRRDWIQLWVTGDNLRKGAASNAVQIMMELFA